MTQSEKIIIVRITGTSGLSSKIRNSFFSLGLYRPYQCTILHLDSSLQGILGLLRGRVLFSPTEPLQDSITAFFQGEFPPVGSRFSVEPPLGGYKKGVRKTLSDPSLHRDVLLRIFQ